MAMIIDTKAQKMYMVMDQQRMYMEQAITPSGMAGALEKRKPDITRTGKTETIAGYSCEHWLIKDDGVAFDACVAKGLGPFFGGESPMGRRATPAWYEELKDGLFPLKVMRGDETVLEVTGIEKKSLDASLFAPPAGYQKMDLPAGMRRP